jgi:hypothetical protein
MNDYRIREIFNRIKEECGLYSSDDYPKRSPEHSPAHRFMRLILMVAGSDSMSDLDSNFGYLFEVVALNKYELFVCLADTVCGLDTNPVDVIKSYTCIT